MIKRQVYTTAICPQRILEEAINIINTNFCHMDKDQMENADNNMVELRELIERLNKAGITMIRPNGTTNLSTVR
jgi:hypothetical protein